jgi:AraC-like DNA-binding protein
MGHFIQNRQGLGCEAYFPRDKYADVIIDIVEVKGTPQFEFERILPEKGPELLININNPLGGKFNKGCATLQSGDYFLKGNPIYYMDSYVPPNGHFVIIKFTNDGFFQLTKIPAFKLGHSFEINPHMPVFDELITMMMDEMPFQERVDRIQDWVEKRINFTSTSSLAAFIEKSIEVNPHSNMRQLEKKSGYSAKYLNRKFKAHSGYTISNYKRLCRFQQTVSAIRNSTSDDWADIIYQQNFYDQSHFIKELKCFSGLTPTDLRQKLKPGVNTLMF